MTKDWEGSFLRRISLQTDKRSQDYLLVVGNDIIAKARGGTPGDCFTAVIHVVDVGSLE